MRKNFLAFFLIFSLLLSLSSVVYAQESTHTTTNNTESNTRISQIKIQQLIEKINQLPNLETITTEHKDTLNKIMNNYYSLTYEEKETLDEDIKEKIQKIREKQNEIENESIEEFLQIFQNLPSHDNITINDQDSIHNAIDKFHKIQGSIQWKHQGIYHDFQLLVRKFLDLRILEVEKQLPDINTLTAFDFHKIRDITQPLLNEYRDYYSKKGIYHNTIWHLGKAHFDKIRQLQQERSQEMEKQREENRKRNEELQKKFITNFENIVTNLPNVDQITLKDEEKFQEAKYNCLSFLGYSYPEVVNKNISTCPELKDVVNETILQNLINQDLVKKYLLIEERINQFKEEISHLSEKISNFPEHTISLSDETEINKLKSKYDTLAPHQQEKIQEKEKRKLQFLLKEIQKLKDNNSKNITTSSNAGGGSFIGYTTSIITHQTHQQTPTLTINTNNKTESNAYKIFPNFVTKKEQTATSLTDAKLLPLQQQFNATTEETRNQALTRGEFLQIILDTAKVNINNTTTNTLSYSDVNKDSTIAKYIAFATNNQIVSGYNNNTFRPNAPISRAEATKILVNSLNVDLANEQNQFKDISPDNTLGRYIQTAFNLKLLNGTSATTFEPNRTISRGELIKIIYNILN